MAAPGLDQPLLAGANPAPGLVAAELADGGDGPDTVRLFVRQGERTAESSEPLAAFLHVAEEPLAQGEFEAAAVRPLRGAGPLRWRVDFDRWREWQRAKAWLTKKSGFSATDPAAPCFFINDPIQQHLMATGRTLFKGLAFGDLRRLQLDLECATTEGFEFCNAEREGDRIIAIALADSSGWRRVLSGADLDEAELLRQFVAIVRERDPDVLEGHNVFNFDLPYLAARAARHDVPLALGRDGSAPRTRPGRFSVGERTMDYTRFDVFGRHVVDTLFLAHAYDISHRSLEGFGLKEIAQHFGVAAPGRVYLEGSEITREFRERPARLMQYAEHDVVETEAISRILSPSLFAQTQVVPMAYQQVCVRGAAGKIDALLVREYLRQGVALPLPDKPRPFAGGYTDLFRQGVIRTVHHCDVRSLYPSLMLARAIGPRTDELRVFHAMLDGLRTYRLEAKARLKGAVGAERAHLDALQSAFKILINSFYGYLGFGQARFSDFDAAERVTAEGRDLLRAMIEWLRARGAEPVEIDTDGIYFVPPAGGAPAQARFRAEFAAWLPEGIEIEFDGEYEAMFSYKMKNYALLQADGEMLVKGAALKSRGLEPFQRQFLNELIRRKLQGQEAQCAKLRADYEAALREGRWPIAMLARTETLQDAPSTYSSKIDRGGRGRSATYELALKSGRVYKAGDQISYYVTGTKKTVPVHANAKLASDWNPEARDENVPYYLAKLDALYRKFGEGEGSDAGGQGELDLGA
jgi:DNA polymerase elongation subunit (family B)